MKIKKNIYSMYAISLLQGMVFYAPIATLYRQARGLTISQIAVIESVYFIFSIVMEVPWGMLADKIGYRKTMIACCGLWFISKLVFYYAEGFTAFLLERLVLSVALAGFSGVDVSILFLSCGEGESQKVFGRYDACGSAGLLLSSVVYAVFVKDNYGLAALLTAVSYGAALLISFCLTEVHVEEKNGKKSFGELFSAVSITLKDGKFLLFLVGVSLYNEAVQMVTVWLNQNQYLRCGMTEASIGWAYIAMTVVSLVSVFSKQASSLFGAGRFPALVLTLSAAVGAVLAFTSSPAVSLLCIMAVTVGSSLLNPLISELQSKRVAINDRATQLSVFALLENIVAAGANLVYGRVADVSLSTAFLLGAVSCVLCAVTFYVCYNNRSRRECEKQG